LSLDRTELRWISHFCNMVDPLKVFLIGGGRIFAQIGVELTWEFVKIHLYSCDQRVTPCQPHAERWIPRRPGQGVQQVTICIQPETGCFGFVARLGACVTSDCFK